MASRAVSRTKRLLSGRRDHGAAVRGPLLEHFGRAQPKCAALTDANDLNGPHRQQPFRIVGTGSRHDVLRDHYDPFVVRGKKTFLRT